MDEDLARILATGGSAASRELSRLHDLAREFLPENEELRYGIASALAEVGLKVMRPAFDAHPGLEAEFQRRVDKYGRTT
ncbi:hypothetical protein [Sphingomonas mali]|uniref:hypothetical protein n=1 Tax=Sphingomonas mali TaxID=40682 RepID=UPI000837125D|nr:hypothetical protein [Sphingomonas mali]